MKVVAFKEVAEQAADGSVSYADVDHGKPFTVQSDGSSRFFVWLLFEKKGSYAITVGGALGLVFDGKAISSGDVVSVDGFPNASVLEMCFPSGEYAVEIDVREEVKQASSEPARRKEVRIEQGGGPRKPQGDQKPPQPEGTPTNVDDFLS